MLGVCNAIFWSIRFSFLFFLFLFLATTASKHVTTQQLRFQIASLTAGETFAWFSFRLLDPLTLEALATMLPYMKYTPCPRSQYLAYASDFSESTPGVTVWSPAG